MSTRFVVIVCGLLAGAIILRIGGGAWADSPSKLTEPSRQMEVDAKASEGLLEYRFEHGRRNYSDLATLTDGSMRLGKAIEWADEVLIYGVDGRAEAIDARDVANVEFRRSHVHRAQPPLPDLTIAYIECLPRQQSWQGKVFVEEGIAQLDESAAKAVDSVQVGGEVVFRVHVLNAGAVKSFATKLGVTVDGSEIGPFEVPPLDAGERKSFDAKWKRPPGTHAVRAEVLPLGGGEINQWNNVHEQATDALAVAVAVTRDFYDQFKVNPNAVDSYCFEDWIRYQLGSFNALMARSVHPAAPHGVHERVTCDRIVILDEAGDWRNGLLVGSKADGRAEYQALLEFEADSGASPLGYDALKIDWPRMKSLALQLGLADLAKLDTRSSQCLATDLLGLYVQREHRFPIPQTLTHTPGGFRLLEPEAAYLNSMRGRPRGSQGDYQYLLPAKLTVVVHAGNGQPLEGAQIDAYQLQSEGEFAGMVAGVGLGDPLYSTPTDSLGRFTLLNQEVPEFVSPMGIYLRPNPFGRIAPDGSNGLLLLKLRYRTAEEFHFLRLHDFLSAYLRGDQAEHLINIQTRFGTPDALPAPTSTAMLMEPRDGTSSTVTASWFAPPGYRTKDISEFRVYRRTSFGGDEAKPWRLVATRPRGGELWWLQYQGRFWQDFQPTAGSSLDTFYAVSCVDNQGRESNLSAPGFGAWGKDAAKLAIHRDHALITLVGDGPCQMLRWDGERATQPYGVRNLKFPGYEPTLVGIAINSDHRVLATDPLNHVLAIYNDRGELDEIVPDRGRWPGFASDEPGEFYAPWDVAVDGSGRVYVADFGNDRVQVLDSSFRFLGLLDEGAGFKGPHAVAFSNGHLCVTDRSGTRCRVYDASGDSPSFVRELPLLIEADRGLVSRTGRVYITGRIAEKMEQTVLAFSPDGETASYDRSHSDLEMGKVYSPRGFYFFINAVGDDYGYCVNSFPFDVRRHLLE